MAGWIELVAARPEVARLVGELAARVDVGVVDPISHGGLVDRGEGCRLVLVDGAPGPEAVSPVGARAGSRVDGGAASPTVVVVHLAGEADAAGVVAEQLGADVIAELPAAGGWLVGRMREEPASPVLGVVGALGGVGATTVALASAVAGGEDCLLIDADPRSTGLDLPLGIAVDHGGRWDAVPDTAQPLVAHTMRSALPRVGGLTVLTGTAPEPGSGQVPAAVAVGRTGFRRTVIDCGRDLEAVRLVPGDLLVLVCPATLSGVVAARRVLDAAPEAVPALLAVRPTAWLPTDQIADLLGVGALELPRLAHLAEAADCGEVLSGRVGRGLGRMGESIWRALA